jgi:hypothetical protein
VSILSSPADLWSAPTPPWFAFYGVASYVYRLWVMLSIAVFVATQLHGLGAVLAAWTVISGVAYPMASGLWQVGFGPGLHQHRLRAILVTGSAVACLAGARFDAGGTIENLTTSALIGGLQWGVLVEGAAGFVTNLGTIGSGVVGTGRRSDRRGHRGQRDQRRGGRDDHRPVNLDFTGTQPYTTEIDASTVNIGQGHTVTLETPSIFGGTTINLGASSDTKRATLVLNAGSISSDSSVVFSNPLDTLVIGVDKLGAGTPLLGQFDATIGGFQAGDQIVVDTAAGATFSLNGSVLSVTESGNPVGVLTFDTPAAAQAAATSGALTDHVLCFLAGTLITTPSGQTPVERLEVGDMVRMASGQVRPNTWIGEGRVLATRGRRNAATPVIVRKGALGPYVPHADLRVTKGHSFFIDGVLIPVEFLVNHRSILWDDRAQEVFVHHIELETHDVLLANGAQAESYRDDGNRWLFRNANSGWTQPPKPPCAPVLTGGPEVDAVWRRLLDGAGPRPSVPLTDDPDLHLVVDGVRLEAACVHEAAPAKPGERTDDVYVFALPARPGQVRVASRAAVPQELGITRDPRRIGVAVRRIAVRQGTRFRVARAGDKRLADGFHPFEAASGVRWTDGEAVLPAAMFAEFAGAVELAVHLAGTARYIDDGARRRSVA